MDEFLFRVLGEPSVIAIVVPVLLLSLSSSSPTGRSELIGRDADETRATRELAREISTRPDTAACPMSWVRISRGEAEEVVKK
jgi:hypothetical protein